MRRFLKESEPPLDLGMRWCRFLLGCLGKFCLAFGCVPFLVLRPVPFLRFLLIVELLVLGNNLPIDYQHQESLSALPHRSGHYDHIFCLQIPDQVFSITKYLVDLVLWFEFNLHCTPRSFVLATIRVTSGWWFGFFYQIHR